MVLLFLRFQVQKKVLNPKNKDNDSKNNDATLKFEEKEKKFDPEKVYKGIPNPTKL